MSREELEPDPPLTAAEKERADALSELELITVDESLLANVSPKYQKVAFVVGSTMLEEKERKRALPDVFYVERIRQLVQQGRLESRGNLSRMRYSEVRTKQE